MNSQKPLFRNKSITTREAHVIYIWWYELNQSHLFAKVRFASVTKVHFAINMKHRNFGITDYFIEYLEQVGKLKRTSNVAQFLQIVQKICKNYGPCLYLSIGRFWWLNELWLKRCIQKCTLLYALMLIMTSQIW